MHASLGVLCPYCPCEQVDIAEVQLDCDIPLQMLLAGVGWPIAEAHHPAATPGADSPTLGRTMQGSGLQSAQDELKVQVLSLQVVSLLGFTITALP